MESRSTNDEHVIARQQKIVRDWNSMSVEKMMSNMVDKGLSYDDYAIHQHGMDKQTMTQVFTHLFEVTEDLEFTTKSLIGTQDFTAWEYFMTINHTKDSPVMGPAKGLLKLRGTAMCWWSKDDKIEKCRDYGIWVDEDKEPR